jgi:hypothetical protein
LVVSNWNVIERMSDPKRSSTGPLRRPGGSPAKRIIGSNFRSRLMMYAAVSARENVGDISPA